MARSKSTAEQRRYPRVPEVLPVAVARGSWQFRAKTVNVSCGGVLCVVGRPLPLMTRVALTLELPRRLVRCRGAVVRCRPAAAARGQRRSQAYRVAVLFMEMKPEDHRAVAEFVLQSMLGGRRDRRRR